MSEPISFKRRTVVLGVSALRVLGANGRIRGAIIGSGNRGKYLIGNFKELGVEMAAVCDVYEPNLQAGLKASSTGAKPYDNYKRLLDDKSLDAVIVATPDHWHAQMMIDAVESGKDVYVEKPLAHTVEDGFRMIEAVRRTGSVVQVGTQRRSFDLFIEAKKIMDSGALGPVRLVNSWWLNYMTGARPRELTGKLDWRQWLGSAPKREPDPALFFNWHYMWDYAGGMMSGQGAHIIDAINWFMNSSYPAAVSCSGTKPSIPGHDTPATTCMCMEYPDYLAVFTLGYQARLTTDSTTR